MTTDMRRIIKEITFICVCILTVSCGRNDVDKTLDCVENIVISKPDSALMLLDSIKNPYKLTNLQRARCAILALYAKDLTGADISPDTTIIDARNYLTTVNNPKYLAFAEYYLGRIYQAHGRNDQALKFYLDAKTNAGRLDNHGDIKGLIWYYIGEQYYMQRKYDNAIDNFKPALKYFDKSQGNYKRKIAVLNITGNCFFLKNMKDSAMICYNEALQSAITTQDSSIIMKNLGMVYLEINETGKAKQQLFHALNLNSDLALRSSICLNLCNAYKKEQIADSVIYFATLALQFVKNNDDYVLANIYHILSNVENERGNYKKAYEYYRQYTDCVMRISNERHNNYNNIQVIEAKHNSDMFQRKNNNLTTQIHRIIIIAALVSVIVVIISFRFAGQKKKVAELKEDIAEKEKEVAGLKEKIVELEKKLSDYDIIIGEKEKVFFQIMQKNIKKISKNELPNFCEDINMLYNNTLDKTGTKCSELRFKIICLTCIDFDNYDIASILNLEKHFVEREKSEIRKILNIAARGDIKAFFLKNAKTNL
jgi:tetratricopeptide (TPR) repeat protein